MDARGRGVAPGYGREDPVTYTTAHKDYKAATLEEAAAAMLKDPEIWRLSVSVPHADPVTYHAAYMGYSVESWDWDGKRLRVNFR